ncbi:FCD domain protein [compost metagenome]
MAALYLTAADIDELEANVDAMRQELRAGRFIDAARLDFAFHRRCWKPAVISPCCR